MKKNDADQERYAALLFEASKLLGAPPKLKSAFDALMTDLLHYYDFSVCLLLTEKSGGVLEPEFSLGLSSAFVRSLRVPRGEGALGVVFASGLARQMESPSGDA